MLKKLTLLALVLLWVQVSAKGQPSPVPVEGDFTIRDFRFESNETLPELKLHYRTLGTPSKDPAGVVRNAVLILHGTGGPGNFWLERQDYSGLYMEDSYGWNKINRINIGPCTDVGTEQSYQSFGARGAATAQSRAEPRSRRGARTV